VAGSMEDSSQQEDYACVLARFAVDLNIDSLPPEALIATKSNVFDTLACAAAGSSAMAIKEARDQAVEWAGAPQASILVFGDRVPAHHAAWVNGSMAHARDYDDTHDAAVLHAGVSVVPAALAAAQLAGTTNGKDFIAGVAAGLETICRLGVARLCGSEDLEADVGSTANRDAAGRYTAPNALARSLALFGATAAKVPAVDAVYTDFRDAEGLRLEALEAVREGFSGKAAIHPDQVAVINAAFTPSAEHAGWAARVVAAFDAAPDRGAISLDGRMLDRPHYRSAQRVRARAGALQPA
jgi:citrate lyase beta subunit